MSETDLVLCEREGAVALVTLNRPDKLNALSAPLLAALERVMSELAASSDVACAILTGSGQKAFAAGADIAAMLEMTTEQARAFSEAGHRVCSKIEAVPFPVIGAINGVALGGGCEIALACDFLYASDNVKLGQPEVNLGLMPGFGGTQRLLRRVGAAMAAELVFSADLIGADEALRIGLVNQVVPAAELLARAKAQATKIAGKAPLAVAASKRALRRAEELSLQAGNELERELFALLFATADQKEGTKAFLEKRAASWTAR